MLSIKEIFSRRGILLIGVTLLIAAAIGGCGDDSSMTKAELVAQGDAICKTSQEELRAQSIKYQKEHGGAGALLDTSDLTAMAKSFVGPAVQLRAEELADLEAPAGDESDLRAIVEGLEKAVAESEAKPLTLMYGNGAALVDAQKSAKGYGFKVCGAVFE